MASLYCDGIPACCAPDVRDNPDIGIISWPSGGGGLPVPDIESIVLEMEGESGYE